MLPSHICALPCPPHSRSRALGLSHLQATRPLATGTHSGIDRVGTGAAAGDAAQDRAPGGGGKQRAGWDISQMAPKLKGEG